MPPFDPHLLQLVLIIGVGGAHVWWVREVPRRRRAVFGWLLVALVTLWPVGDLAAKVSVSVGTVQRLVIMLAVAPLFLSSVPASAFVALTRPALVDPVTKRLGSPPVALGFVTVLGTLTLSAPVVDAGATSATARTLIVLAVVVCGLVLWAPALGVIPGARRLSPIGRAAYLFVAALVVTSLSFVWIFARHPLYPALEGQLHYVHMSPLLDQQVAGFIAKLGSYVPMWAVAFTIFARADEAGEDVEDVPLNWIDVERQLLRADRQRARESRRRPPGDGEDAAPQG